MRRTALQLPLSIRACQPLHDESPLRSKGVTKPGELATDAVHIHCQRAQDPHVPDRIHRFFLFEAGCPGQGRINEASGLCRPHQPASQANRDAMLALVRIIPESA